MWRSQPVLLHLSLPVVLQQAFLFKFGDVNKVVSVSFEMVLWIFTLILKLRYTFLDKVLLNPFLISASFCYWYPSAWLGLLRPLFWFSVVVWIASVGTVLILLVRFSSSVASLLPTGHGCCSCYFCTSAYALVCLVWQLLLFGVCRLIARSFTEQCVLALHILLVEIPHSAVFRP